MNHALSPKQFSDAVLPDRRQADGDVQQSFTPAEMLERLSGAGYVILKKPPVEVFHNKSLIGLDPYAPDLTIMQKLQVVEECKVNPWYFYFVFSKESAPEIAA
jgi:hypothetical protein